MMKNVDKISLIFLSWLVIGSTSLYYIKYGNLQLFDPDEELAKLSSQMKFDKDVESYFKRKFGNIENIIFHIKSNDCACNIISASHIIELNDFFSKNNYTIQYVSAKSHPDLSKFVPSTPAVVIFNNSGRLTYLGPYSSGAYCTASNSFVSQFSNSIINGTYLGAHVIHDAYGCYCREK
mgnify:CR=1 FL=1